MQRKIFFRRSIFLYYSPYPNLEGTKDALCYKFRRLTIGQNCCAVCTNKVARTYIISLLVKKKIKIVPIIPPPGPSRRSFGELYGVILRTLPQACFQGWGVFKGDPGWPLNPNNAQDHAAVFSYRSSPVIARKCYLLSWNN